MSNSGDDFSGSSIFAEHVMDALKEEQKAIDGQFPSGRVSKHDKGALAFALGVENGKVCLRFPHPVTWMGFPPEDAIKLAEALIQHARKASVEKVITIEI